MQWPYTVQLYAQNEYIKEVKKKFLPFLLIHNTPGVVTIPSLLDLASLKMFPSQSWDSLGCNRLEAAFVHLCCPDVSGDLLLVYHIHHTQSLALRDWGAAGDGPWWVT